MMMMNKTGTAKAKYVVEIGCQNGNVFLHGPFSSSTKANEYLEEAKLAESALRKGLNVSEIVHLVRGTGAEHTTYKVRMVMHPTKWTQAVR
jgi:hypothetical protein